MIPTSGSGIETLLTPTRSPAHQSADPARNVGIACGPTQGTGTPSTPTLAIVDLGTMSQVAYTDYVIAEGVDHSVHLDRDDSAYTCTATAPSPASVTASPPRT